MLLAFLLFTLLTENQTETKFLNKTRKMLVRESLKHVINGTPSRIVFSYCKDMLIAWL